MCPLYDPVEGLNLAMAGNGDPYAVLSPRLLRVLRDLGSGLPLSEVATRAATSVAALRAELAPLVAASLVSERGEGYRPGFCILDREEVMQTDRHAAVVGERLAGLLLERWDAPAAAYRELAVSKVGAFADLAFFLVGDRILDVGLLDALAEQGSLMPAAPARPSPTLPEARYYLWMIAGVPEQLGRYGQRTTGLPWPGWQLLTFGEYHAVGGPLAARRARSAGDVPRGGPRCRPGRTRCVVGRAVVGQRRYRAVVGGGAGALSRARRDYAAEEATLRRLYGDFATGRAAPERFGEFFCWYDHVAYAHAIDALVAAGAFALPADRFAAVLWQEGHDGRVLGPCCASGALTGL